MCRNKLEALLWTKPTTYIFVKLAKTTFRKRITYQTKRTYRDPETSNCDNSSKDWGHQTGQEVWKSTEDVLVYQITVPEYEDHYANEVGGVIVPCKNRIWCKYSRKFLCRLKSNEPINWMKRKIYKFKTYFANQKNICLFKLRVQKTHEIITQQKVYRNFKILVGLS